MKIKWTYYLNLILIHAVMLTSCKPESNASLKDFFEKYTETAAIETMEIEDGYNANELGEACISSNNDITIAFYMRNPQKYNLIFTYTPDDSSAKTVLGPDDYSLEQTDDKACVLLRLSESFLKKADCDFKDISGTITLTEATFNRKFDSYKFKLNVDSIPPGVKTPCYQRSSANDQGKYVVCFYLPDVDYIGSDAVMSVHKNDTRKIFIDDELLYFHGGKIYKDAAFKEADRDERFSDVAPEGLTSVSEEGGFVFSATECPAGYTPIYFNTGIAPSSKEVRCKIRIQDDGGLFSLAEISSKGKQLSPPVMKDMETLKMGVIADEETGLYTMEMTHDGLCSDGSKTGAGDVVISYTVYDHQSNDVVKSGSGSGSVRISVPKGLYRIEAVASKPYFIESDNYSSADQVPEGIKIRAPAIFYVKDTGDNQLGLGSRTSPFRSVQKALDVFEAGLASDEYSADIGCVVRVLSDITPCSDDAFPTGNNSSLVYFKKMNTNYTLEGVGGKWRLDARGSESTGNRRVISGKEPGSNEEPNIHIRNLIISGGYLNNVSGAGIYVGASYSGKITYDIQNVTIENNTVNYSNENPYFNYGGAGLFFSGGYSDVHTITLTDCTIQSNHAKGYAVGGGILSKPGTMYPMGTIKLCGKTVISDNDSEFYGGGIFVTNKLLVEGSEVRITGNKATKGAGVYFSYDYAGGIYLSGPVVITDNEAMVAGSSTPEKSNVFLSKKDSSQAAFTVQGDISGSKIGFMTEMEPSSFSDSVCFTSGYGYGTKNKSLPHTIFVCDSDYAVRFNESKEAELFVSGGSVSVEEDSNFTISASTVKLNSCRRSIDFTLKDIENQDLTSKASYVFRVYSSGVEVPARYFQVKDNRISLEQSVPCGKYHISVVSTYNEKKTVANFFVTVEEGDDLSYLKNVTEGQTFSAAGDYHINSSSSLQALAMMKVSGMGSFVIDDDIELDADYVSGSIKSGIGKDIVIDGNNHTISGVTAESTALFYSLEGTIKNLNVEGEAKEAGLVAIMKGGSLVENCKIAVDVSCSSGNKNIGGITGESGAVTIQDCIYSGTIRNEGSGYAGGVIGKCNAASGVSTITGCSNTGEVYGGVVGGIIGYSKNSLITDCKNEGHVNGENEIGVGGIVGESYNTTIRNCENTEKIYSNYAGVAGIVGRSEDGTAIIECVNRGEISGVSYDVGGIYGQVNNVLKDDAKSYVDSCINYGSITGSSSVGGIAGSGGMRIMNCMNFGNVTANRNVAGIVAGIENSIYNNFPEFTLLSTSTVVNCVNYGQVNSGSDAGGIVSIVGGNWSDYYNFGRVMNCVNIGTLVSEKPNQIKGIHCSFTGPDKLKASIENNYFISDVGADSIGEDNNYGGTKNRTISWCNYSFKTENGKCTTYTSVSIGGESSMDVVELLNQWIDDMLVKEPENNILKRWKYDEDGRPTLDQRGM